MGITAGFVINSKKNLVGGGVFFVYLQIKVLSYNYL
nr:MAG TPA: hypothetical protein [Caudoviricetes sp.]